MSLINDMLRNVHRRAPSGQISVLESSTRISSRKKTGIIICSAGVFLGALLHFGFLQRNDMVLDVLRSDPFYVLGFKVYDKMYDLFTPDAHFSREEEGLVAMELQSESAAQISKLSNVDMEFTPPPSKVLYFTHQMMDNFFQKDAVQGIHTILAEDHTIGDRPEIAPVGPSVAASPGEEVPAVNRTPPNTMRKNDRVESRISEDALSQAAAFMHEGQTDSARTVLQDALQSQPLDHEVRAALADFYIETKNLAMAEKLLQAGLDLVPDQPVLTRVLARAQAAQGKYESAITLLLNAPPVLRDQPEHYSLLAALYQKKGRYDLAAQIYMDLVHFFPQNGRWWTGLGISLEETRDTQAAFDSYMRSLAAADLDPSLRSFVSERITELSKTQGVVMNGQASLQSAFVGG